MSNSYVTEPSTNGKVNFELVVYKVFDLTLVERSLNGKGDIEHVVGSDRHRVVGERVSKCRAQLCAAVPRRFVCSARVCTCGTTYAKQCLYVFICLKATTTVVCFTESSKISSCKRAIQPVCGAARALRVYVCVRCSTLCFVSCRV